MGVGVCLLTDHSADAAAPSPKQSPIVLPSPLLAFCILAQPFDAPTSGNKLGRLDGFPGAQGNDVGVVRVGDLVELFHGQVQKSHHENAQSQPMGDPNYTKYAKKPKPIKELVGMYSLK